MSPPTATLTSFRSVESVLVEISPGELIDKITILEIKIERIKDATKVANIRHELAVLRTCRDDAIPLSVPLERLIADLKIVNKRLWVAEDELRESERQRRFDDQFIKLARAVYRTNDRRSAIKAQINTLLGATIAEEKSYADY